MAEAKPIKKCARCAVSKPHEAFSRDRRRKDGRYPYCRECDGAKSRERYRANVQRESERKRAAYLANRDRFLARNRAWREANREREREQHKEYYRNNRDVFIRRGTNRKEAFAAIAKFKVTRKDLRRALSRHGGACFYCRADLGDKVTWDHVVPVSRGGAHSVGNLVPACRSCNCSKNNRTITEWRRMRARTARKGGLVYSTRAGEVTGLTLV